MLFTVPLWIGLAIWALCGLIESRQRRQLAATMMQCPRCTKALWREAKVCRFCDWRAATPVEPAPLTATVDHALTYRYGYSAPLACHIAKMMLGACPVRVAAAVGRTGCVGGKSRNVHSTSARSVGQHGCLVITHRWRHNEGLAARVRHNTHTVKNDVRHTDPNACNGHGRGVGVIDSIAIRMVRTPRNAARSGRDFRPAGES